jgi:hypothetical protein
MSNRDAGDTEEVPEAAEKAGVHPAIAAGHWRLEHSDDRRFSKLIGRGEAVPLAGLGLGGCRRLDAGGKVATVAMMRRNCATFCPPVARPANGRSLDQILDLLRHRRRR